MAGFNEKGLKKKLDELNPSQQSIQTLSLWLIHHKKHAHTVVNVWFREVVKAPNNKKLTFMYLANDVIQNSRRKGPEYSNEYKIKLPKVFEHLSSVRLDEKSQNGLLRLLNVWQERSVFDEATINELRRCFGLNSTKNVENNNQEKRYSDEDTPNIKKLKEDFFPDLPVTYMSSKPQLSLSTKEPPETEAIISALQELENAATGDAAVREKIAHLPAELSDVNYVTKLEDIVTGKEFLDRVNSTIKILDEYNKRLADEMEARKGVARMLHEHITYQKEKLAQAEQNLEEHRVKLETIQKVKQELRAHLQNLPDISKLPTLKSGCLAPLPSAGDLFT